MWPSQWFIKRSKKMGSRCLTWNWPFTLWHRRIRRTARLRRSRSRMWVWSRWRWSREDIIKNACFIIGSSERKSGCAHPLRACQGSRSAQAGLPSYSCARGCCRPADAPCFRLQEDQSPSSSSGQIHTAGMPILRSSSWAQRWSRMIQPPGGRRESSREDDLGFLLPERSCLFVLLSPCKSTLARFSVLALPPSI